MISAIIGRIALHEVVECHVMVYSSSSPQLDNSINHDLELFYDNSEIIPVQYIVSPICDLEIPNEVSIFNPLIDLNIPPPRG